MRDIGGYRIGTNIVHWAGRDSNIDTADRFEGAALARNILGIAFFALD